MILIDNDITHIYLSSPRAPSEGCEMKNATVTINICEKEQVM